MQQQVQKLPTQSGQNYTTLGVGRVMAAACDMPNEANYAQYTPNVKEDQFLNYYHSPFIPVHILLLCK